MKNSSAQLAIRGLLAFCLAAAFCGWMHINYPTKAQDGLLGDYSTTTLMHAITFDDWLINNNPPMNLSLYGHPALPYFVVCGLAWQIAKVSLEEPGNGPLVNFFDNVDKYWVGQAVAAGLIFSLSVMLFVLYAQVVARKPL